MVVLMVHNFYQQPGGEDQSFAAEAGLLEAYGHTVCRYTLHNDAIQQMSALRVARATIWNTTAYRELRALIRRVQADVVHFQNTFPLVSPAGYYAAQAEGVPVVQSLRNYRLMCPNGLFFRDGRPCELCLGRLPWPGVRHACYRNSRPATAAVATMLTVHRALGTWSKHVDAYVALTAFARQKFIEGGLPAVKIAVKPNFVYPDPGPTEQKEDYALFVGRLSAEKGLDVLLEAWPRLGSRLRLKVVGDGPLAGPVQEAARANEHIEWLGRLPYDAVLDRVGRAALLVIPSVWHEPFGRVAIEAYAKATPVVASDRGALAEIVEHERTGLLFRPGDADDLAAQVAWLLDHPTRCRQMGKAARRAFETTYSAERNYEMLMAIYEAATA
ncbi:MAG: glycosyltransferase [Rhodothermales bacterium]